MGRVRCLAISSASVQTFMKTAWLYVRVQAFVFVCGIVGPIFLAIFFTDRYNPEVKWMFYAGAVITAIDVLIALSLTRAGGRPRRNRTGETHD